MPDEYLETKGELTGDLAPKQKRKKRRWWDVTIEILMFCLIGCIVAVSANILYLKCAYGYAFFVDGVSMYPTLNGNALKLEKDGSYSKVNWSSGEQKEGDYVDYGWAKMGEKGIAELERFDIVITYYSKDMEQQKDGTFAPKSGSSLKVKRLIAFPGETVQLTPDLDKDQPYIGEGENKKANLTTPWGTLTITSVTGEVSTYPSFYTFEDYPDVNGRKYRDIITADKQTYGPTKLAENQYFVLGDNRASTFSEDCRSDKNRVYDYCLQGKAYLITSLRKLKKTDEGYSPEFSLDKVRPFWDYTHLDNSPIAKTKKETSSNA